VITGRQCPDRMEMIGQYDEGVDREGMVLSRFGNGFSQGRDMIDEVCVPPLQKVDGEEPTAAGNERATIVWYGLEDSTSCVGDN